MDALECLFARRTAKSLTGPGPDAQELATVLQAATTAPDHKRVRPWRFVVVSGDERHRFAEALSQASAGDDPERLAQARERNAAKVGRAPTMVMVIAAVDPAAPVPRWEQVASTAAAAQTMCLAATAIGLGSAWRSTPLGDRAPVRDLLGMGPDEELLGWIDLGRPGEVPPAPRPPVELASMVSHLRDGALAPYVEPA